MTQKFVFTTEISKQYKEVSDVINSIDPNAKDVRVRTFKQLMQESFFHGIPIYGDNFIA
jgi:hypothetical protein